MLDLVFVSIPTAALTQDIKIFVDGKQVITDADPFITNNRTFVSLRFIADYLEFIRLEYLKGSITRDQLIGPEGFNGNNYFIMSSYKEYIIGFIDE